MGIDLVLFRKVIAKEYASLSDDVITMFAAEAENEVSKDAFGALYARALCLLTAHLIFISDLNFRTPGAISSSNVGAVSRVWTNAFHWNRDMKGMGASKFGVEFQRLVYRTVSSPVFVSS